VYPALPSSQLASGLAGPYFFIAFVFCRRSQGFASPPQRAQIARRGPRLSQFKPAAAVLCSDPDSRQRRERARLREAAVWLFFLIVRQVGETICKTGVRDQGSGVRDQIANQRVSEFMG
jgi:hypothetical protein